MAKEPEVEEAHADAVKVEVEAGAEVKVEEKKKNVIPWVSRTACRYSLSESRKVKPPALCDFVRQVDTHALLELFVRRCSHDQRCEDCPNE